SWFDTLYGRPLERLSVNHGCDLIAQWFDHFLPSLASEALHSFAATFFCVFLDCLVKVQPRAHILPGDDDDRARFEPRVGVQLRYREGFQLSHLVGEPEFHLLKHQRVPYVLRVVEPCRMRERTLD